MSKYKIRYDLPIEIDDRRYRQHSESNEESGHNVTLYRIEALIPISEHGVNVGDLGGFVKNEKSLSQIGNAWVGGDAKIINMSDTAISGHALVTGNAEVWDDATVEGEAIVTDYAKLIGYAKVKGRAFVGGVALIRDRGCVLGTARVQGGARVEDDARVRGASLLSGTAAATGNVVVNGQSLTRRIAGLGVNGLKKADLDAASENEKKDITAVNHWQAAPWSYRLNDWLDNVYFSACVQHTKPFSAQALCRLNLFTQNPAVITSSFKEPITQGDATLYFNSLTVMKACAERLFLLPDEGTFTNLTLDDYPDHPTQIFTEQIDKDVTHNNPHERLAQRLVLDVPNGSQVPLDWADYCIFSYPESPQHRGHVAQFLFFEPSYLLGRRDRNALLRIPASFSPINFSPKRGLEGVEKTIARPPFDLEQIKAWHYNHVLRALAAGETIPYSLLVEYKSYFEQLATRRPNAPAKAEIALDFSCANPHAKQFIAAAHNALAQRREHLGVSERRASTERVLALSRYLMTGESDDPEINDHAIVSHLSGLSGLFNASQHSFHINEAGSTLEALETLSALTQPAAIANQLTASLQLPLTANKDGATYLITNGQIMARYRGIENDYYAQKRAQLEA